MRDDNFYWIGKGNEMIEINSTRCSSCGFCLDVCPNYVFALGEDRVTKVRYPEQCCRCGHCVAICPENALIHEEMPAEKFENLPLTTISPETMRDLLLSRRSIRAYKEKSVPKELIEQLIEVGIHAGTSSNGQTENFIVIQDQKLLSDLEKKVIEVVWNTGLKHLGNSIGQNLAKTQIGDEMVRQSVPYHYIIKNRRSDDQLAGLIFRNAPVVIVIHGLRTNLLARGNCWVAARNIEIMAKTMGLGTCLVGFLSIAAHFDKEIGKYLAVPDNHNIYSAIMVGYPKHEYKKTTPRKERQVRWI